MYFVFFGQNIAPKWHLCTLHWVIKMSMWHMHKVGLVGLLGPYILILRVEESVILLSLKHSNDMLRPGSNVSDNSNKEGTRADRLARIVLTYTTVNKWFHKQRHATSESYQDKEYKARHADWITCPETDERKDVAVIKREKKWEEKREIEMPLTHLAEPRPHHLPPPPPSSTSTNITIGEDTYTVLGEYLLKW